MLQLVLTTLDELALIFDLKFLIKREPQTGSYITHIQSMDCMYCELTLK